MSIEILWTLPYGRHGSRGLPGWQSTPRRMGRMNGWISRAQVRVLGCSREASSSAARKRHSLPSLIISGTNWSVESSSVYPSGDTDRLWPSDPNSCCVRYKDAFCISWNHFHGNCIVHWNTLTIECVWSYLGNINKRTLNHKDIQRGVWMFNGLPHKLIIYEFQSSAEQWCSFSAEQPH